METVAMPDVAHHGPFYDTGYPFRPWRDDGPWDPEIDDDGTVYDRLPFLLSGYDDGDWGGWDTDTADEQGNLPGSDEPN